MKKEQADVVASLQNLIGDALFEEFAESMAKVLVEQQQMQGPLLLSKEMAINQKKKVYQQALTKELQEQSKILIKAVHLIRENLDKHFEKDEIEVIEKEMELASVHILEPAFAQSINEGMSVQEALSFSKQTLFAFYTIGYELFKQEMTEDALAIFTLLTFLNGLVYDYWIAKGICHQKREEKVEALIAFTITAQLFPDHPEPKILAIEIHLASQEIEDARGWLAELTQLVRERPDLQQWQQQIDRIETLIRQ